MKKLTTDDKRIQLVERLVKDGAIDFTEAIELLQVEVEKEFIYWPTYNPNPPYWFEQQSPFQVTCDVPTISSHNGYATTNLISYSNGN